MASILLFNTSFKNKGDALMNEAVVAALGSGHRWAVPASLHLRSRRQARSYGLCLTSDLPGATWKQRLFNGLVSFSATLAKALGRSLRERLGVSIVEDIDVAIDVSGYCYGDVWGDVKVEWGERTYRRLKQAGARVILMPKTWGPFNEIPKSSVSSMLRFVDLAYARDEQSKRVLDDIMPAHNGKVRFAPDYTHMVDSITERSEPELVSYIIPSYRVIDSDTLDKAAYYGLLSDARRFFAERGLNPKLLIHEVSNDMRFVQDAADIGFAEHEVVLVDDPIELKRLIAGAAAVVTSRLHGLYNALNSAVPVAVIAWVFKYRQALRQYSCEECLVDLDDPARSLKVILEMITSEPAAEHLKSKMKSGKANAVGATNAMWSEINRIVSLGDQT